MDEPRDNTPPQSLFAPWRWNRRTWFGIALFSMPLWIYIPAAVIEIVEEIGYDFQLVFKLIGF